MAVKYFLWDEDENITEEFDENFDRTVAYTHEPGLYGDLISQRRGGNTSYYHYDGLGSTRELTDETETITDKYLYDAWGNIIATTGTTLNSFQWTGNVGYYFDPDTGNFYIRERIYGPTIGRWLSVDPVNDGNRYGNFVFVSNSPMSQIDASPDYSWGVMKVGLVLRLSVYCTTT